METITSVKAIKEYFESDGGRPMPLKELSALSMDERVEIAELCAKELGKKLVKA